ncbi:MAG: phosphate signaling complex protein PhoU [Candidatus Heimdallarchaeota archaeon]|nr:phosphate signaling complex protein PhoU [Candidatus Heimdallarchaeota archaeon]
MSDKKEMFGGTIRFKRLMSELMDEILTLSNRVTEMINCGIDALLEDDEALFERLQGDLDKVHSDYDTLEDSVIKSIALHQPFARDLRFLISSLKIGNEIHRCAHNAVHIAHTSKFFDKSMIRYDTIIKKIDKLSKSALDMFKKSVEAFIRKKTLDVNRWEELDDVIDDLHKEVIDEIVETMLQNTNGVRAGVSLVLTSRYIERIADHACNIAEEAIYVVTSKRVKID